MLPKQHRLPLRTEFKRLKKDGHLVSGRLFSVLLIPSALTPRFAFIVSKKIDKRAVKRNQVKRWLSEAVWSLMPKIKPGLEAVFLAKREIAQSNFAAIKKEVEKILLDEKINSLAN